MTGQNYFKPLFMTPLIRTNNLALISFVEALLKDARIDYFVADQHISSAEGSIGPFPRRIMIDEDDLAAARALMTEADLAHELEPMKTKP